MERPAHQWKMGVTSQNNSLPTPPVVSSSRQGPCHLPLLARGEVSGFCTLGPGFQVMDIGSRLSAPQRDGVGTEGLPMDGEKTLGAGCKSQATSRTCSVGPSSVMDASDLDAFSFVSGHASGNRL